MPVVTSRQVINGSMKNVPIESVMTFARPGKGRLLRGTQCRPRTISQVIPPFISKLINPVMRIAL
jgi:hypothetical protein